MSGTVREIGLMLGADRCWPDAFEDLLSQLGLVLKQGEEEVRFQARRLHLGPFELRTPIRSDVVIDRLKPWHPFARELLKKAVLVDGVYALNNPWSQQSCEKHTSYCAMARLGFEVPKTWTLPPKRAVDHVDYADTAQQYHDLFKLEDVGAATGLPAFLKPYNGGGWVNVSRVKDGPSLHRAYDASGNGVMHLQASVENYTCFTRTIAVGPQVNVVRYQPDAPLHDRYAVDFHFLDAEAWEEARRTTLVINAFFGWDFNSCEALVRDGRFHLIDFANACPDSQVTSLHYHWPGQVLRLLRWSLFCAWTGRSFRHDLGWPRYLAIAEQDMPWKDKLDAYYQLAWQDLDGDRFYQFCNEELSGLTELALEYFESDRCREVIRNKVAALYPAHEIDSFTEHFFGLVRFWVRSERSRLAAG